MKTEVDNESVKNARLRVPPVLSECVKECIRFVFFIPVVLGLSSGEMYAENGSRWCRFLIWLYGEDAGEPEFPVIWPEDEESDSK